MKYSFIIPVYNGEKYIKTCVESILDQTYKDFEIIIVDDESTDSSYDICKNYKEKYKNIYLYKKKNSGTSATRNYGLKHVNGDYVIFIDNDDYWDDANALKKINDHLEESHADILMFDCKEKEEQKNIIKENNKHCDRNKIISASPGEALKEVLNSGSITRAVWTKVIKRSLIEENNIRFPEGMRNEDTDVTAQLFLHAQSYDWLDDKIYVYRKNTGVSQTSKPINYSQLYDLKQILKKQIKNGLSIDDDLLKKSFFSYLAFPFSVWLGYASNEEEVQKSEFKEMKSYSRVLLYDFDKNVKKLSFIYRVFGYSITRVILKLWVKVYR